MESIENLKYAILNEWTDDPPVEFKLYYDTWFESLSEVKPIVDEIIDHVKTAIGYEEEYAEDFEDDLEGLDPFDEDGKLTSEDLAVWDWDNGGSGCGCVVYAEGADIADAAAEFLEDLLDDNEEVGLDEDDEGNYLIEFPVTVCMGHGDGGDVLVEVPVTSDEFIDLLNCYREDTEISDCENLENLVSRIESAAADEAETAAEELDDELDCSEASYIISFPEDIPEIADVFVPGLTDIEIKRSIERAKADPTNIEAVMPLLKTIEVLVENENDSTWWNYKLFRGFV